MIRLLILCLLLCRALFAREIATFEEALVDIDRTTWVVVDIDDTLIRPMQTLGTTEWAYHRTFQRAHEQNLPLREAFDLTGVDLLRAQEITAIRLIEPGIADHLRRLQDSGNMVIGLTSRPNSFIPLTRRQLLRLGIDLSRSAPRLPQFELAPGDCPPTYTQGILHSYMVNKGETLVEFMRIIKDRPTKVVFVDDSERNVARVTAAMAEIGLECDACRYTALDNVRAQFDPEIAEIQWSLLGRILTDEQARLLLEDS